MAQWWPPLGRGQEVATEIGRTWTVRLQDQDKDKPGFRRQTVVPECGSTLENGAGGSLGFNVLRAAIRNLESIWKRSGLDSLPGVAHLPEQLLGLLAEVGIVPGVNPAGYTGLL